MNALLLPVEYCTRVSERPLADGGRAALHRVRGRQRLEVPLRHAADGAIVARDRAVLSLDVADPPVKVGRVAPSVRPAESTAFLPSKNKTVFLRCHMYNNVKTNILPRQARDKPRENTQNTCFVPSTSSTASTATPPRTQSLSTRQASPCSAASQSEVRRKDSRRSFSLSPILE